MIRKSKYITVEILPFHKITKIDKQFMKQFMTYKNGTMGNMLADENHPMLHPNHQITICLIKSTKSTKPIINWTALVVPDPKQVFKGSRPEGISNETRKQVENMTQFWAWTLQNYRKKGYATFALKQLKPRLKQIIKKQTPLEASPPSKALEASPPSKALNGQKNHRRFNGDGPSDHRSFAILTYSTSILMALKNLGWIDGPKNHRRFAIPQLVHDDSYISPQ